MTTYTDTELMDIINEDTNTVNEYNDSVDAIENDMEVLNEDALIKEEEVNAYAEDMHNSEAMLHEYDAITDNITNDITSVEEEYGSKLNNLATTIVEVDGKGVKVMDSELGDISYVTNSVLDTYCPVRFSDALVAIEEEALDNGTYETHPFTEEYSYAQAVAELDEAIPRADGVTEQLKEEGYAEDLVNLWTDYVDSVKQYRQQLEAMKDVKVYETCDKINDMKAEVDSRNNSDERAALVWNVESAQEAYEQAKAEYDELSAQLDAKLAELEELKAREPEIEALKAEIAEMKAELEARIKQAEEEAQKKAEEANNKVEEEVNEKVEEVTKTDELPKTDIIEQVVEGTVETIPTEPVKTVEVQKAAPVVSVPTGVETSIGGAMTGLMMSVAMLSSMVAYKLKHH